MLHNVKITPVDAGHYTVELDGKPVNGVTDVQIAMHVDCLPTVWIGLRAGSVEGELNNAYLRMSQHGETNNEDRSD